MFEKLKSKWKVKGWQLFFILSTFAIGGSMTGFTGKKIMNWLAFEKDWLWTLVYILLVIILWPFLVLLVSIPLGQFRFFSGYTRRLGERIGLLKQDKS
jgi:polyferredoxin